MTRPASLADLFDAARAIRGRLEPGLLQASSLRGHDWDESDAIALALVACHEVRRPGIEVRLEYVEVESVLHPLVRVISGDNVLDVDMAGDRFGGEPVRVAPAGSLYPGARSTTRFLSVDVHNDLHQKVVETLQRAGLSATACGL